MPEPNNLAGSSSEVKSAALPGLDSRAEGGGGANDFNLTGVTALFHAPVPSPYAPSYGDLTRFNTSRTILDATGPDLLRDIISEILVLVGTSSAVYEKSGDYALGIFSSGWCRMMDEASYQRCGTPEPQQALSCGQWLCHESCWTRASKTAMEKGAATDVECAGGLRLYALPIYANGEIVGAINFGYGDPPRTPEQLAALSEQFRLPVAELQRVAAQYESRPDIIIEIARKRLESAARQIGLLVERKKAEQALAESADKFHSLYNNMQEGVALHELVCDAQDRPVNYRIVDVNPQYETILGLKRETVVNKLATEAYGDASVPYLKEFGGVAATQTAIFFETYYPHMQRHFLISVCPWRQNGFATIFLDITARKQAEEAVRQSEEKFRSLFETMAQGVVYQSAEGSIISANRAAQKILGLSLDQMQGRTSLDPRWKTLREDGSDLPGTEHPSMIALRTRHPVLGTVLGIYHPELKQHRWLLVDAVPEFKPGADAPYQVYTTFTDITERRHAEEEKLKLERQMQQTQKLESLGVLAGGIAHDFNNLLTAIMGNINLALLEMSPLSPGRSELMEAEKATCRAADLAKQMLAYSGKGRFTLQMVDLEELIEEMTHMLKVSISKKVSLRFNFAPELPLTEADATQIRQIIMNLVINASEAIGDNNGVISLATGSQYCDGAYLSETWLQEELAEGDYVYVEVADTGCGIAREQLAKIFDPFFTTKFTGRGLGLAAVLGIIRGHKGAIKIYSEPGKGTNFKVLLPVSKAAVTLKPNTPVPAPALWQGSGQILLVDDEEAVREAGKKMLERLGFTVVLAEDGQVATEIFRTQAKDLYCVMLDLTMPKMDGEETFRELRKIYPTLPVFIASGYNEQDVAYRFAGRGVAGFIQKPYNLAVLREALQSAALSKLKQS